MEAFPVSISPENSPCNHLCGPPITIQSRFNLSFATNSSDFWGTMVESIYYTLPDIIHVFRPDFNEETITDLTNDGTIVLANATIDAMQHKTNVTAADLNSTTCQNHLCLRSQGLLQTRDIFGDIRGFLGGIITGIGQGAEDLFCSTFALSIDPAFSAAAGTFHSDNSGAVPLNDAQLIFFSCGYRLQYSLRNSSELRRRVPSFLSWRHCGYNFHTYIFTKFGPYNTFDYNKDSIFSIDQNFAETTAVVVHETLHVLQYASFG